MSDLKLSEKQYQILEFIFDQISMVGQPPTIREICDRFGFASPRSASDHLKALEKKGYIHRSHSPRGIQLAYDKVWALFGIPIVDGVNAASPRLLNAHFGATLTPSDLYPVERDLYAVYMPDDSMDGDGIRRDDLLIVREQAEASSGDVVLAWVKDADKGLAVRTLRRDKSGARLEAARPDVPTVPLADATLLGVVLRVVRNL